MPPQPAGCDPELQAAMEAYLPGAVHSVVPTALQAAGVSSLQELSNLGSVLGTARYDWPAVRSILPPGTTVSTYTGFKRVYDEAIEMYPAPTKATSEKTESKKVGKGKWIARAEFCELTKQAKLNGYKPVPRLEPSMETITLVHSWCAQDLFPRIKLSQVQSKEDQELRNIDQNQRQPRSLLAADDHGNLVSDPNFEPESRFMKPAKLLEKITILENALIFCGLPGAEPGVLDPHHEQIADCSTRFPARNAELLVAEAITRGLLADSYSEHGCLKDAVQAVYQSPMAAGPRTFFRKVESVQPATQPPLHIPQQQNRPRRTGPAQQPPAQTAFAPGILASGPFQHPPTQPALSSSAITNFEGKCRAWNTSTCTREDCYFNHVCALVGCSNANCEGLKKSHPQACALAQQAGELEFQRGKGKGKGKGKGRGNGNRR